MATDAGPALGDEHGALRFADHTDRPKLGDLVRFSSPHCDPTINLHNQFHVVREGLLVNIRPIEVRGYKVMS